MAKKGSSLKIRGGRILGESGITENGLLVVRDGRIDYVGTDDTGRGPAGEEIDARGFYVGPGFIDLHLHGAAGANFLDANEEAVKKIVDTHARYGTTGMLATLSTAPLDSIEAGIVCLSNMVADEACEGLLGIHLEGPYINPAKCGAHPPENVRCPERAELLNLIDLAGESLKIVTLAPEVDGARSIIVLLKERGVTPAVGHSEATYRETREAFSAGVRYVVHLFNAMSGLHHRHPGVAAAVLMDKRIPAELILDGVHVDPAMVRLAVEFDGWNRFVLVTDCMQALDADCMGFRIGKRKVTVRDGVPRLESGVLCGTMLTMNRAVRNMQRFTGVPLTTAFRAATLNPARVLGIQDRKGSLEKGKDADIIVFDEGLDVRATIIGGEIVHSIL